MGVTFMLVTWPYFNNIFVLIDTKIRLEAVSETFVTIDPAVLQEKSFKIEDGGRMDDVEKRLLFLLYARLKNGRIMLYPFASIRPSVRPSVCKPFVSG